MMLHETIHLCRQCFTFSETRSFVSSAAISSRDPRLVCVVEEPGDQIAIEKTGAFRGTSTISSTVFWHPWTVSAPPN
jgi:recombination protein RecR